MHRSKREFSQCVVMLAALALCVPAILNAQSPSATAVPEHLLSLDKRFVDAKADPCVDFFKYACGNFTKLHPIPSDRSEFDAFSQLADNNDAVLRIMLEKAATGGASRTPNEQKIGDYYAACMDIKTIDERGKKSLQAELDRIDALKSEGELPALLAHYQLIGVSAFINYGEQQDYKDARRQIAVVDQGGLGLPERDYYLRTGAADEKIRQQYVQHIANTLKLLGEPEAQAMTDARKVMDLETALAKVSLDVTSQRDPNKIYHMMTLVDLDKLAPNFSWNKLLMGTGTPPVTELNVAYPPFFKGLNTLLESTDLDTIRTYLRWQLVASLPSLVLPTAFDEEAFNFNNRQLRGTLEQQPRWKRCVGATDRALGEALGQVYVAQEFPPASKAATLQMVHDIEGAMDQDIDQLDWMSAATKVRAKEKLQAIANKIGYPNKWRDYSKLNVGRDDALGNAIRATEFETRRQLAKIGQPVDHEEFGMSPPTVNAYYNPSMNDINFPAGILAPPFFDPHTTDAVNYGHIGGIVGHELTHGFDDQGRQFDANGNLADWWTPEDGKKFNEKADCEVKEYGNFIVDHDAHVNGKLTLGENTADNGGLRLAYIAFLADAKRKSLDLSQKQDGYTPAQQFFVAYGQNWCGSMRPEQGRLQVQTDPHSPDEFRANGTVQNIPEFGQAFGCKTGQPMMPEKICHVW